MPLKGWRAGRCHAGAVLPLTVLQRGEKLQLLLVPLRCSYFKNWMVCSLGLGHQSFAAMASLAVQLPSCAVLTDA